MGFIGSINDKLRKFFYTQAGVLDGRDIFIGCSGNFTIEQIISRRCPAARIFSNDVSLYSSTMGHYLTGRPFRMDVVNDELRFISAYMARGPAEAVACMELMLAMFKYEKRNNPFSIRMWQSYMVNFESLLFDTTEKLKKAADHIRVQEYSMVDVYDYYPRSGAVSIGFLPTYVGGYEKLFKHLDESISWDCPRYEMLTTERREGTIEKMTQGDYILYDDQERGLPCVARVDLPGKRTVFIYSNLEFGKGIFRKKINETVLPYPLLMPDEEIPPGAAVTIRETDLPTINHFRNLYLSKKIQPGSGGPCYMVFAGVKLFGFLIFQIYSQKGGDPRDIYMLSDFVVPSTRYQRLAKLLLMVTRCREMKQLLDEKSIRDYRSILTTAFTDKPVSMKYRGLYELAKRGETADGKQFLNYRGEFDQTTLQEVVTQWTKRFNKQGKPQRG